MSVSSRQIGLPERNDQSLSAYGEDNDLMESFYEPDPDQDLYGRYFLAANTTGAVLPIWLFTHGVTIYPRCL
jgi:hypothetical protein